VGASAGEVGAQGAELNAASRHHAAIGEGRVIHDVDVLVLRPARRQAPARPDAVLLTHRQQIPAQFADGGELLQGRDRANFDSRNGGRCFRQHHAGVKRLVDIRLKT
jgi:hypothetical protein